jgi:hypothetical protein
MNHDGTILMVALSFIKFDITFGASTTDITYLYSKHFSSFLFKLNNISEIKLIEIIPFLFISKYDPILSVREIMEKIWKQLIIENCYQKENEKDLINNCLKSILTLINKNLLNSIWKEREAACLSLESLLLMNCVTIDVLIDNKKEGFLANFLEKGFKLLDDIRESTRKTAINLMKKMLSLILRYLASPSSATSTSTTASSASSSSSTISKELLDIVLPIFLDKGLVSPSVEARGFCLGSLLQILNNNNLTIEKKWLEKLIDIFIESMSALEPQMLQYMEFHIPSSSTSSSSSGAPSSSLPSGGGGAASSSLPSSGTSREEYERLRVSLSQQSPLHEGLRKCLTMISLEDIGSICSILYSQLHGGIGLATRVAAADSFSFLTERYPSAMSKYGIKAIQELCKLLSEKPNLEITLKKSLMNSLGSLAKVVESSILLSECEELVMKLFSLMKESILNPSYNNIHNEIAIVIVLQQIIKKAGERIGGRKMETKGSVSSSKVIENEYSSQLGFWLMIIGISYCGSFDSTSSLSSSSSSLSSTTSSQDETELKNIWNDIFLSSLEYSGFGNKISAISRAFSIIYTMITYLLNHNSWEKRKQGIKVIKDILHQVNHSHKALSQQSYHQHHRLSQGDQDLKKVGESKERENELLGSSFEKIMISMICLLPGSLWQGQDMLIECLGYLFPLISSLETNKQQQNSQYFSYKTSTDSPVLELSLSSLSSFLSSNSISVESPFLLSAFIPPSFISASSSAKMATVVATTTEDISISSPIKESAESSATNSNSVNMEVFKQIRDHLLNSSVNTLITSMNDIIQNNLNAISLLTQRKKTSMSQDEESHWKINLDTMISLLFYELKRGDINYRITVAQSLSSLPWKDIKVTNPAIFIHHFHALLAISELDYQPPLPPPPSTSTSGETSENVKKIVSPSVAATKPVLKNAMFFGSRYGAVGNPTATRKKLVVAPPVPVGKVTTEPEAKPVPVKRVSATPPAIRMHIVECLTKGWINSETLGNSNIVNEAVPLILRNIFESFDHEAWSLKRVYLQLLGSIGSEAMLDTVQLSSFVEVTEKSQQETKYSQVKLAGLELLHSLLLGKNKELLKSTFQERISLIIRNASSDIQPLVLETVARLTNLLV